jgi:hypothetical protein
MSTLGLGRLFYFQEGSMNKKRLEATAYHEAGHAVACYHLHLRFTHVTIIPDDDSLGAIHHGKDYYSKNFDPESDNSLKTMDRIEREVISSLAGQAAEAKYRNRNNWKGSVSDWSKGVDFASRSAGGGEVLQKYVEYCWARAKALFNPPWLWYAVEVLARELLKDKKIGSRKARQIIKGAFDDSVKLLYSKGGKPT